MTTTSASRLRKFQDCPCAGKNLDKFVQPMVLATLRDGPLHGYLIVQRFSDSQLFQGQEPDPAGVYRHLKAMERRGLVTSTWDMSAAGPAKRLYDLTAAGRKCIGQWLTTLEQYHRQVGQLMAFLRPGPTAKASKACACRRVQATKISGGRLRAK